MQLVAVEVGKKRRWKVDRDDTRSLHKRTIIFSCCHAKKGLVTV